MDTAYPVWVVLFRDSKIARDAYGLYFTGFVKKSWTFNRMVIHAKLVRKILKHREIDPNIWSIRMTMKVSSFYEYMNNDNEMRYLWTIRPNIAKEGIHVLVEFIPIQPQTVSISHDTNTVNISEHVTAITQMVSDEPSMLYPIVDEDDDDNNDHSDEDYAVSSESDDDDNTYAEEEDIHTPVNPAIENTVTQWQSS
ncbi:hypothetical protein M9H77_25787 [Catharanthus roseus]|uniref:Uncharacterized protein n=1 Tax=Catharanthus roseus TaxID=4058 RepID=A0ACC0A855_CATRO|nr:hypothetical protein M9H77_25787 [Catharanthus roseus]